MSGFKKSPLAYIDDEIAQLTAADIAFFEKGLLSPSSVEKYLSKAELTYLAQSTFKEDFSEYFSNMNWAKPQ